MVTRRSHPPALLALVEKTLFSECGVGRGDRVLVAVSGGSDSTALLHVLSLLAERGKLEVFAHGVDHGLRATAASELEQIGELCRKRAVQMSTTRVDVGAGGNLQARARRARFDSLEATRQRVGARWIATAHHADDRAETVLMRLLRGSGARGLGVLPPVDGNRVRPLVRASRRDVLLHLERHGIEWSEDPSNSDRRFLRSRVRFELLPLLRELSPNVVAHLNNLADDAIRASEAGPLPSLGRAQVEQLREILRAERTGGEVRLTRGRILRLDREPSRPQAKRREKSPDWEKPAR